MWSHTYHTLQFLPTCQYGLCFGYSVSGPLPLCSHKRQVTFYGALVFRLHSKIGHIHLSIEAQCDHHRYYETPYHRRHQFNVSYNLLQYSLKLISPSCFFFQSYNLEYRVFDGLEERKTQVQITIEPRDIFPPKFDPLTYQVDSISEYLEPNELPKLLTTVS